MAVYRGVKETNPFLRSIERLRVMWIFGREGDLRLKLPLRSRRCGRETEGELLQASAGRGFRGARPWPGMGAGCGCLGAGSMAGSQ